MPEVSRSCREPTDVMWWVEPLDDFTVDRSTRGSDIPENKGTGESLGKYSDKP